MEKEQELLNSWQWRTTLKTMHVLLQKAKFYKNYTKVKYLITTNRLLLFVPDSEDSQQKKFQEQQELSLHPLVVTGRD
jgi:hypothetical protein